MKYESTKSKVQASNEWEVKVTEGSVDQGGIKLRRVALPGPILISITVRGAEKERFSLITAQRDEQLAEARGLRAPTRVRALDKHTWTERRDLSVLSRSCHKPGPSRTQPQLPACLGVVGASAQRPKQRQRRTRITQSESEKRALLLLQMQLPHCFATRQ